MSRPASSPSPDEPIDDEIRLAPLEPLPPWPPTIGTSSEHERTVPHADHQARSTDDAATDEAFGRPPQYTIRQLLLATTITALVLTSIRWAAPELLTVSTGVVALGFFAWVSFTQPQEPRLFAWSYTLLVIYVVLCVGTCIAS